MKAILITVCIFGIALRLRPASFLNLNFEEANTNNAVSIGLNFGARGTTDDLIPNWSLFNHQSRVVQMGLNAFPSGGDALTIASRNGGNQFFNAGVFPLEGNFALFLPSSSPPGALWISQTGTIPTDAHDIAFLSFGYPMELRINGNLLPLTYTYSNPHVTSGNLRYGVGTGDISSFAGMDVELRFSVAAAGEHINGLDDIRFLSVPEPGTLALLGLGGLMLGWRTVQQRRRR